MDNHTCQDCVYFKSGRCPEEDEDGEICDKFRLPKITEPQAGRGEKYDNQ